MVCGQREPKTLFKGKIMNALGYGDVEFEVHMGDTGGDVH